MLAPTMISEYGNKLKKFWLLGFCLLVVAMVCVGGITRLTRSGLSIVEWKPVSGIIPPISESDWQQQFELYKQTPEYEKVNSHFELADYKQIFMWEYLHRVLGRLIFFYVVFPGLYLWRKKFVSGKLVLALASLVATQGLIGWLMVKSGLNVKPHVSPFMLALHFFAALSVLIFAFYHFVKLQKPLSAAVEKHSLRLYHLLGIGLALQVFYGCLTSGLKAGIGYNTYPLMNGQFFPEGGLFFTPYIVNFFENPATVQWTHRWLGISVAFSFISFAAAMTRSTLWRELRISVIGLLIILFLQVALGILNILLVVPISLATLHQLVATLLVLVYFNILFRMKNSENAVAGA